MAMVEWFPGLFRQQFQARFFSVALPHGGESGCAVAERVSVELSEPEPRLVTCHCVCVSHAGGIVHVGYTY